MPCHSDEEMSDLRCMSFTSKATSEILVAGLQNTMFVVDVNKGEIVKRVCAPTGLSAPRPRAGILSDLPRFPPQTTTSR